MVQDGEVYHYHLDHLGTPQELSNSEGKIVWKARYTTYGNVAYKEVDEIENNIRFQGQYFDEESGLHYNRHRYYDPGVGQFTTQDPIGLLGGINNYAYAPNPTGWIDPFGLSCSETASQTSASYQGSDPYFGVDHLDDITLEEGTIVAHITWKPEGGITGNYFTTPEAVEASRAKDGLISSKALNQGVQVYAGDDRTNYKKNVQLFKVKESLPFGGAAFGATKANPQFNPGRYKTHDQYFIQEEYLDKLEPVPGSLEAMKNTEAPDISEKLDKMRKK